MKKNKISIVIPVYNNEATINIIYNRIKKVFKKIKLNYEIIFVDDYSPDSSLNKIKKICNLDKKVICVKLTKNFGQRFATMAGLKYASGDFVTNLDADLQDPPELIEKIVSKLKKGNQDIVIAARKTVNENLFRRITSYFQHRILNSIIRDYPKEGFTVWCISKRLVSKILKRGNNISLIPLEILNYGYNYSVIYYERQKRFIGRSQWTFKERMNLGIEMMTLTTFSILRYCLFFGAFLLLASLTYIGFVFYAYFERTTPFQGYSPIIIVSLFLGGLNIFVVGILAEYISVILREVRSYDKYNVKSVINHQQKDTK
jgi:polyisoprenyl-phosphate glycosyltransferase